MSSFITLVILMETVINTHAYGNCIMYYMNSLIPIRFFIQNVLPKYFIIFPIVVFMLYRDKSHSMSFKWNSHKV